MDRIDQAKGVTIVPKHDYSFKLTITLLSALMLLTTGCKTILGGMNKTPSRFTLDSAVLTKSMETRQGQRIPKITTDHFSSTDEEVIYYLSLTNISGSNTLYWKWYTPKNDLYHTSGNLFIKTSQPGTIHEFNTTSRLLIKGTPASKMAGEWKVKTYNNHQLIDTRHFKLEEVSDLIAIPEGIQRKPYPKDWGLIIGVESYAHLPRVEYARKDALMVQDYYTKVLGIPEKNIVTLIDQDATEAILEGYLEEYFPQQVRKDSTLYVYFAGHGMPDPKTGVPYIMPYDGDLRFLEKTGFGLKRLYQTLNRLKAHQIYVFIDSCFSGVAARNDTLLAKNMRPALIYSQKVEVDSKKIIAFTSSSQNQLSSSYPEREHGLFTYYLLRALSGDADRDDDHWVSLHEMFTYVVSNVTRVGRTLNIEQTPFISPSLDKIKDVAISKVLW